MPSDGLKKKKVLLLRPFCWYCDREFLDEDQLVHHQRQRHLRCLECGKRFNSVRGLKAHYDLVHSKPLTRVPRSLTSRSAVETAEGTAVRDVFGMDGIPLTALRERADAVQSRFPNRRVVVPLSLVRMCVYTRLLAVPEGDIDLAALKRAAEAAPVQHLPAPAPVSLKAKLGLVDPQLATADASRVSPLAPAAAADAGDVLGDEDGGMEMLTFEDA
jgi:DNA-directed RNA polymerase subunit RPC12/RpoP